MGSSLGFAFPRLGRPRRVTNPLALVVGVFLILGAANSLAGWSGVPTDGSEKPDSDAPAPFRLTEAEIERVLDLFGATSEVLTPDGRLELVYHFERESIESTADFLPKLHRNRPEIRWPSGDDGASEGVSGVLIADQGQWFHRAVFAPSVSMNVEFMSFCGGARNDLVCATFGWTKNLKRRVASNLGTQGMALSGTKCAAKVGGEDPVIQYEQTVDFGFELDEGTFKWTRRGQERGSTDHKKVLKKLGPGQVGLVWNGRVSACIRKITIAGQLDWDWLAEQVPAIEKRLEAHREQAKEATAKKG